ncbi:hypothetical protein LTR56_007931 [Elasticomyces elasticus]|nr:hypothetical protein LTR22_022527 [Elasticomyces elasticus]KAK3647702.1 hypothetical protein LTR56_007931 [Elasticomyces elasticus]KAK4908119.1 hypothetical protein LTR49_022953 [Elasticomyces elasticus]KAK5748082.1 hypothetical protein LTS12_021877 [Elasticomyces elasticus]
MSINAADFFGKDIFSDVTIKFDNCEFRAHRMILSCNSKYFARILETNTSGIIALDEPGRGDAIGAMLRSVYNLIYVEDKDERRKNWKFHLRVAAVAGKYRLITLRDQALDNFNRIKVEERRHTNWWCQLEIAEEAHSLLLGSFKKAAMAGFHKLTDERTALKMVLELFEKMPRYRYLDLSVREKEMFLFNRNFLELLQVPEQASRVDEQPGLAIYYLVRLAEAVLQLRLHIASNVQPSDCITVSTLDHFVQEALKETPPAELA